MPGPLPKHAGIRSRRNKKPTRAVLTADDAQRASAPQLPPHPLKEKWHEQARAFWQDVWRSPMASEYLAADVHGLIRMLVLTDRFAKEPSAKVSAELRMLSQQFGLSPTDRRRLEWTIAKTEDAVSETEHKRVRRARPISADPREVLEQ